MGMSLTNHTSPYLSPQEERSFVHMGPQSGRYGFFCSINFIRISRSRSQERARRCPYPVGSSYSLSLAWSQHSA